MSDRYRLEFDSDGNERFIKLPIRVCGDCGWFANTPDGFTSICMREAEHIRKKETSEACGDFAPVVNSRRENEDEYRTADISQTTEG